MSIRCGVAGLNRGSRFVEAFDATEGCEVVAVCDPDPGRLPVGGNVRGYTDYGRFIAEAGLDVVAIISPGPLHFEQTLLALESGVHVLCETPCVYSVDEAAQVVRAVETTGLKYMLSEDYIWHGWVEQVRGWVEEGRLGEIVYAEGDYTHDCRGIMLADEDGFVPFAERERHPNAKRTWRATHLPPLSYCSHTLGPLLHLMRDRAVLAVAMDAGAHTWPEVCPSDLQSALLRTERGAVIRLTNGFCLAHPFALAYSLCGTQGSVKLSDVGGKRSMAAFDGAGGKWQPADLEWRERRDGRPHLHAVLQDFVQSVRDDTPPPLDVYASMDCVVPGLCALESARNGGQPVEIPDFRK